MELLAFLIINSNKKEISKKGNKLIIVTIQVIKCIIITFIFLSVDNISTNIAKIKYPSLVYNPRSFIITLWKRDVNKEINKEGIVKRL